MVLYRQPAILPVHLPTSLSQRCELVGILFQAPALLAALSSQDRAALSNCSKQLWRLIHNSVTSLFVQDSDVEAVLKREWPQLALVKFQPKGYFEFTQIMPMLQDSKFQLIAFLEVPEAHLSCAVLIIIAKPQVGQHTSVAAAFKQLQQSDWQDVYKLTVIILSQAESVTAQMAQCEWPHLEKLNVP